MSKLTLEQVRDLLLHPKAVSITGHYVQMSTKDCAHAYLAIDAAIKARDAAAPVAYIATPCDPRGDPVLVFNAQGFHPEDFLVEPLYAHPAPAAQVTGELYAMVKKWREQDRQYAREADEYIGTVRANNLSVKAQLCGDHADSLEAALTPKESQS